MTRDDIICMALEAGALTGVKSLLNCDGDSIVFVPEELDRFVELVAAAEREKLKHELLELEKWKGLALAKDGDGRTVQQVEQEARAAEREECAKLCDGERAKYETAKESLGTEELVAHGVAAGGIRMAEKIEAAIRARGNHD